MRSCVAADTAEKICCVTCGGDEVSFDAVGGGAAGLGAGLAVVGAVVAGVVGTMA